MIKPNTFEAIGSNQFTPNGPLSSSWIVKYKINLKILVRTGSVSPG